MTVFLEAFHFLRPVWLLLLPVIALLWYLARPRHREMQTVALHIAPHLAEALRVGSESNRLFRPIDGVALCLGLLTLAAAGPTWSRAPNPLTAETAPLVVALKVTPSMNETDLAPSRLDRARFKILDLIATRAGARTALVAYSGTAHRVAPLTEDPGILRPLLQSLTPEVMPVEGNDATAALALASDILGAAEFPGAVLFVLDDLNPGDVTAFADTDPAAPPVAMLVALPPGQVPAQIAGLKNVSVIGMTADDRDISQIARTLRSAQKTALLNDESLAWEDRGWWLLWPAALIALIWFRRGWTMRWGAAVLIASGLLAPTGAQAEGWRDWFLTPDQQGRLAYKNKEFARAGDLFTDPMWKGYAMLRAGQYEGAAQIFADLDTADAAFAEGLARIRNREYRAGARAFETALERDPDYPGAAENAEIAWVIVEQVESTREQSDTGEESGIGADDIAYDNESQRGATTQIEAGMEDISGVSAEQWIDSIDTDMGEFLRNRFVFDNTQASQ